MQHSPGADPERPGPPPPAPGTWEAPQAWEAKATAGPPERPWEAQAAEGPPERPWEAQAAEGPPERQWEAQAAAGPPEQAWEAPPAPEAPAGGAGWVERLVGADVSRALGAMAGAVGRECNKDLAEAISGGIRDSLLSPVMDRVMRDLLPYMWCVGGLMAGLVTIMAAQLLVSLMILYRSSWGRRL